MESNCDWPSLKLSERSHSVGSCLVGGKTLSVSLVKEKTPHSKAMFDVYKQQCFSHKASLKVYSTLYNTNSKSNLLILITVGIKKLAKVCQSSC